MVCRQLPFFSSFYCTCSKSSPGCNLLPFASWKAIPSSPAVINLSQRANYFVQISNNDGGQRAGFMVQAKGQKKHIPFLTEKNQKGTCREIPCEQNESRQQPGCRFLPSGFTFNGLILLHCHARVRQTNVVNLFQLGNAKLAIHNRLLTVNGPNQSCPPSPAALLTSCPPMQSTWGEVIAPVHGGQLPWHPCFLCWL